MEKLAKKSLEKLPPHNIEAERAVLGAILLDNAAIHRALEIFNPEDFYRKSHEKIFNAMLEISDKGDVVDLLLLRDELERKKELDEVGGPAYLAALVDQVPTAANIEFHTRLVHEKALARNLLNASIEIATRCYDDAEDVNELLGDAEQHIFSISEGKVKRAFTPIKDVVKERYEHIELLSKHKSLITGVATGFVELDQMTSGLQPSDLIILASRPSMGKCLHKDSEIVLSDGSIKTVQEIVMSQKGEILSLEQDFTFRPKPISHFVDDGIKPLYQVTTRSGRQIITTAPHPFLTIDGWKQLHLLSVGEKIGVPRRTPIFGKTAIEEGKIKLIAYFIGDGGLTRTNPAFTNTNSILQQDFIQAISESFEDVCVVKFDSHGTRAPSFRVKANSQIIKQRKQVFGKCLKKILRDANISYAAIAKQLDVSPSLVCVWCKGECAPSQRVFSQLCRILTILEKDLIPTGIQSIQQNHPNSVTLWLQELQLWGHTAHTKTIPARVFTLPKNQLALFLNRLFATDGWASIQRNGRTTQIGYSSVCEKLIRQLQHLLLRFGIISHIKEKNVAYKHTRRKTWRLQITHVESLKVFIEEIGILGKEESLATIKETLSLKRTQSNTDHIPREIWEYIRKAKGKESWGALARRAGIQGHSNIHVGKRALSRKRLSLLANALQDQFLFHLAESDIYWDEIISIEAQGQGHVYDLTIPSTHNFVANDICVHNTSLCLNVAQHVGIREDIPTAIFSLEMSKEQLGMRLLCAEARLDSHDARIGNLQENDWERLAHASEILSKAPIYIDDTPAMSILEMRAKSKRLKLEKDLGIVIVDYLQLMQPRRRRENRQQEITEISRSLKTLAKELNVPVLALSQLSRAVEQRTDKRPQLSDLRESGCLSGDTPIYLPEREIYVPLCELVGKQNVSILSLNTKTWKLETATVSHAFSTGKKPIFHLTTQLGRTLRATGNHKFLTISGWKRLDTISEGEHIAIPTRPVADIVHSDELARLAYSDVSWDRVTSIDPAGIEPVYDLTVPKHHNFVAGNMVVHNSIEQDADVVMFIYRPEVYFEDAPDGIAELIIGKQRNGPIGTVQLAFIREYTRFENLEKHHQPEEGVF